MKIGGFISPKTQKCGSRPPLMEQEVVQVRTIIGTMREHDEQCRGLVGKDFALITVRRYESCTRYLAELIKLKYDKEDLPITEVNGELVRAFELYLKTEKNCQQNTVSAI